MAQQDFGSRLAEARKKRGLTLDQVHTRLRITPAILESLERADFHHMPLKGHARNMVSAYARFLGLDSNELTKQFLREYHDFENHLARNSGNHVYRPSGGNSGNVENRPSSAASSYGQASSQGLNSMWNKPLPKSQLSDDMDSGYGSQHQGGYSARRQVIAGEGAGVAAGSNVGQSGGYARGAGGAGGVGYGQAQAGGMGAGAGAGASSGLGYSQRQAGGAGSGYGQRQAAGAGAGAGYSQRQAIGAGAGNSEYGRRVATGGSNYSQGPRGGGGANYEGRSTRHQYSSRTVYPQGGAGRRRVQGDEGTRPEKIGFGSRPRSRSGPEGNRLDNATGMGSYPARPSLPLRLFGSLLNSPIALVITLILILVLLFAVWAIVANSCKAAEPETLTPKPAGSVVTEDTPPTGDGSDALLGAGTQTATNGFELVITPAAGSGPYTSVTVDGTEVYANSPFETEQKWTVTQNFEVISSQPNNLTVKRGDETLTPEIGEDGFAYWRGAVDGGAVDNAAGSG